MFYHVSCNLYLKKRVLFSLYSQFFLFSSNAHTPQKDSKRKEQKNFGSNKPTKFKKLKTFFKFDRVVCKKVRWMYNSKNFKQMLTLRNRVQQYYDGVFSNSFFKKELGKQFLFLDYIRFSFIKPEFRLDIILWRLNFFSSPYSARVAILKNEVLVNNNLVWFSYYLKQGDIIKVKSIKNLKFNRNLKIMKYSLNCFVEIDHYSNTFIILQDYTSMGTDSFSCVIRQPFKASFYLSYLRLK